MSRCDRYRPSNGSKLVYSVRFVVAIFTEVIRIVSCWIRLVCGDQTTPSTILNYVMGMYVEVEQSFDTLGSIYWELVHNVLLIRLVTFGVCYFQFLCGKCSVVVSVRPVLLGLVPSFGIVERAKHNHHGYVLVIDCLPKVIVVFDWGLTEYRIDFVINQWFNLIRVDVIVVNVGDLDSTVLVYKNVT